MTFEYSDLSWPDRDLDPYLVWRLHSYSTFVYPLRVFRPSLGLFDSSWRFWEPKCWNAQFLPLTWPWPDTWPFKKIFKSALEPSRRDLSNAASPVSLRSLVWELAWGGVIRPPPGQWRSAETPVKRGLSDLTSSCVFRSLTSCQRHTSDPTSLKLAVCSK